MTSPYRNLALTIAINTAVMFALTYALIADLGHFYANINRVYMALMMAAPMVIVMLLAMRPMYPNRTLNMALLTAVAALFVALFLLARTQTPVGDVQFLRSMIPHHSSAILMCREADIRDWEIVRLCGRIVESQRQEIAEMQRILARMR